MLIGALAFSERLTRAKALGVLLGVAGVAVLTRTGPVAFSTDVLLGALACLVATACYGLAGFLARRWIFRNRKVRDPEGQWASLSPCQSSGIGRPRDLLAGI